MLKETKAELFLQIQVSPMTQCFFASAVLLGKKMCILNTWNQKTEEVGIVTFDVTTHTHRASLKRSLICRCDPTVIPDTLSQSEKRSRGGANLKVTALDSTVQLCPPAYLLRIKPGTTPDLCPHQPIDRFFMNFALIK